MFRYSIVLAVLAFSTVVAGDARYSAIDALGQLNGVALQCKYLDQVRRMKAAVVESAPKERSFGLAFDEATNKGFVDFIRIQQSCPSQAEFELDVSARIVKMRDAFASRQVSGNAR